MMPDDQQVAVIWPPPLGLVMMSCSFTIQPNSLGWPALPLRMTSVDGSNGLRSLPSLRGCRGRCGLGSVSLPV
jgi:hypothetical protein